MKKIKLTEMSGFRNPTPEEVRLFGNLVTEECQKQIRFRLISGAFFVCNSPYYN